MAHVLQSLIRIYRYWFSPWLGRSCRFYPSCSEYAYECLDKHGATRGTWLSIKRLARCHPWCNGGCDPVP